jgi:hypothetical protein
MRKAGSAAVRSVTLMQYNDPGVHLAHVHSDAALTRSGADVGGRSLRGRAQLSLHLRLRMVTDGTVRHGRRTVVSFRLQHDRSPISTDSFARQALGDEVDGQVEKGALTNLHL